MPACAGNANGALPAQSPGLRWWRPLDPAMNRLSIRNLLAGLSVAAVVMCPTASARASIPPPPNQAPFDEVRLPSGGFVRGEIEEIVVGRYVVLVKKNGGKSQRFEWSEIDSVVRADGTVLGRDAKPEPLPEPKPDEIEPDETEPDETEPDETAPDETEPDETEPDETEPDEIEPDETEPDETEPDETEPEPAGPGPGVDQPQITLTIDGDGPPPVLHRGSETICTGPCELQIPRSDEEFFVTLDERRVGRGFSLSGEPGYRVDVKRSSPILRWSGVALIPAAVIVGVGIGIIPAIHNVPRGSMIGYAVGGSLIGAAGIAGGVTLIMFSRAKVKVLPGLAEAPRSGRDEL
jgi:hypothetical protein